MGNSLSKYNNLNCKRTSLENITIYGEYKNSNTYHPYSFNEYKENPLENISNAIVIKKNMSENYWESDYY